MKIKHLVVLLFAGMMVGCYPSLDTSVTDADTVVTFFDQDLRENDGYEQYNTYILPDTIVHIIDEEDSSNNVPISREFDEQILSDVRANLNAFGFTEVKIEDVDPSNPPDLVILVEAVALRNWVRSIYCYPPGWGWGGWWGWWPGYPGWGGCGSTVSTFVTGSVYINMLDPTKFEQETEEPEINEANIWFAALNGILSSSVDNGPRLEELVNQAFTQSAYLDKNQ